VSDEHGGSFFPIIASVSTTSRDLYEHSVGHELDEEMAGRAIDAIQQRLMVVLRVAEQALENHPSRSALRVF
jgi:hypothetical protein